MDKITSLLLLSCARDDQGLYPAATVENGVRTERTPWQDGWNAACMDLTRRHLNLIQWFKLLPLNQSSVVASLALSGVIELSQDDDGQVEIVANMNDIFGWASADSEAIPLEHLEHLAALYRDFGEDGVVAYACARRHQQPIAPRLTAKLHAAMERANEILV